MPKVNNQPRKKNSKNFEKKNYSKIFLLIDYHQVEPNFYWLKESKNTKIVIFAKKDYFVQTKARKHLPLTLMPYLLRIIKIKKT